MPVSRSRLLLLFAISLGSFTGSLDKTIVNVSLPVIAHYYQVGTGEVALVVLAYMLLGMSMVLLLGYLGDRIGYRRIIRHRLPGFRHQLGHVRPVRGHMGAHRQARGPGTEAGEVRRHPFGDGVQLLPR